MKIPNDVSVIGFDNSETAENLKPGLTSIDLPIPQMTAKALQHIFDNKSYNEDFKINIYQFDKPRYIPYI